LDALSPLKALLEEFLREIRTWRLVWADPRTPRAAKWLLGFAIAYAISPVDLVPEFIPVFGVLDDMAMFALILRVAKRLVPQAVFEDCRRRARSPK